jgi:hypothetical protein
MFAALSRLRLAAALASCVLAACFASAIHAQTIDLSLNVFYTHPADPMSGGTWQLEAKSSDFGLSAIVARIANVAANIQTQFPSGIVNGSNTAGFQVLGNTFHPANPPSQPTAFREFTIGQVPLFPLPSGSEQTYIYGVGSIANGAPNYPGKPAGSNSIGPAFTSFTSPQGIAWATADPFNDPAWATGVALINGSFAEGVTPSFVTGSTGQVFTSVPVTNTTLGNEALATTITTIVRTNAVASSADYNHDGIVDGGDYVIWRKTLGQAAAPPGSGADGNQDGTINQADYDLWRSHFGNPMGAGSGGGLSTSAVPEPSACFLLAIGALFATISRRARIRHSEGA